MKERKLIICRGIQGSGKSTWAKQWCHEDPEHRVRFNNDDVRNMLGDYWVPSREKLVTEAKANMITFALIKGYDVVVDNMNLNPKEDAWIRTLCENVEKDTGIHVNIEYKDFWTPVEECIRRDAARPNPIGEKVIKETWRRYRNFIISSDIKEMLKNKAEHVDGGRPVILVDMDATLCLNTSGRPFYGENSANAMQETMKYLCENIQGCVLGYTQSDEITLVLIDYQKLTTDAWFDYNVQKMCSVAASMATLVFNRRFQEQIVELSYNGKLDDDELTSSYKRSLKTGAMFDARCFNIPKEEVTNCILWRQQDATRNSISSAGQAYFSHKQLEGLNSNQIQELLFQEKGINWNDYPTKFKRGSCCIKKYHQTMNQTLRSYWFIDNEIPIFKGEDREYIEKLIA